MQSERAKGKHGFASMSKERQQAIASRGGKAAHRLNVAHKWTKKEAQEAGKIGGQRSAQRRSQQRIDSDGHQKL